MSKKFSIDAKRKKCVTPECRGSYVYILSKGALPNSEDEAYSIQMIFPKNEVNEEFVGELKKIYAQVLIDKFGDKKAREMATVISAKGRFPVRDGDDPGEAHLANAEQLKGCYFMSAKNIFRQPFIIGPMGKAVDPNTVTPDDIYSGAWYRCMLEFWYYDKAGNKGIGVSIAGLMKTKDDENLGAGTSTTEAEEAFGDFAEEAASMFQEPPEEQTVTDADSEVDDFSFM